MQPRGVLTKGIALMQLVLHVLAFNRDAQAKEVSAHGQLAAGKGFPVMCVLFLLSPALAAASLPQPWEEVVVDVDDM